MPTPPTGAARALTAPPQPAQSAEDAAYAEWLAKTEALAQEKAAVATPAPAAPPVEEEPPAAPVEEDEYAAWLTRVDEEMERRDARTSSDPATPAEQLAGGVKPGKPQPGNAGALEVEARKAYIDRERAAGRGAGAAGRSVQMTESMEVSTPDKTALLNLDPAAKKVRRKAIESGVIEEGGLVARGTQALLKKEVGPGAYEALPDATPVKAKPISESHRRSLTIARLINEGHSRAEATKIVMGLGVDALDAPPAPEAPGTAAHATRTRVGTDKVENTPEQAAVDLARGVAQVAALPGTVSKDILVDIPVGLAGAAAGALGYTDVRDRADAYTEADPSWGVWEEATAWLESSPMPEVQSVGRRMRRSTERDAGLMLGGVEAINSIPGWTPMGQAIEAMTGRQDGEPVVDVSGQATSMPSRLLAAVATDAIPIESQDVKSATEIWESTPAAFLSAAGQVGEAALSATDVRNGTGDASMRVLGGLAGAASTVANPALEGLTSSSYRVDDRGQMTESEMGRLVRVGGTMLAGMVTTQFGRIADMVATDLYGAQSYRRRGAPSGLETTWTNALLPVLFTESGRHDYITALENGDSLTTEAMGLMNTIALGMPDLDPVTRSWFLEGGAGWNIGVTAGLAGDLLLNLDDVPKNVTVGGLSKATNFYAGLREGRAGGLSTTDAVVAGVANVAPGLVDRGMRGDGDYEAGLAVAAREVPAALHYMVNEAPPGVRYTPQQAEHLVQTDPMALVRAYRQVSGRTPIVDEAAVIQALVHRDAMRRGRGGASYADKNATPASRFSAEQMREYLTTLGVVSGDVDAATRVAADGDRMHGMPVQPRTAERLKALGWTEPDWRDLSEARAREAVHEARPPTASRAAGPAPEVYPARQAVVDGAESRLVVESEVKTAPLGELPADVVGIEDPYRRAGAALAVLARHWGAPAESLVITTALQAALSYVDPRTGRYVRSPPPIGAALGSISPERLARAVERLVNARPEQVWRNVIAFERGRPVRWINDVALDGRAEATSRRVPSSVGNARVRDLVRALIGEGSLLAQVASGYEGTRGPNRYQRLVVQTIALLRGPAGVLGNAREKLRAREAKVHSVLAEIGQKHGIDTLVPADVDVLVVLEQRIAEASQTAKPDVRLLDRARRAGAGLREARITVRRAEAVFREAAAYADGVLEEHRPATRDPAPAPLAARQQVRDALMGMVERGEVTFTVEQVDAYLAVMDRFYEGLANAGILRKPADGWAAIRVERAADGSLPEGATGAANIGDFVKTGQALIELGQKADLSTLFHENAHVIRQIIPAAEMKEVDAYVQQRFGGWTVDAEEWFAQQFESYLREGRVRVGVAQGVVGAILARLNRIFRQVAEVLSGIYADGDLEGVSAETRALFDRFLRARSNGPRPAAPTAADAAPVRAPSTEASGPPPPVGGLGAGEVVQRVTDARAQAQAQATAKAAEQARRREVLQARVPGFVERMDAAVRGEDVSPQVNPANPRVVVADPERIVAPEPEATTQVPLPVARPAEPVATPPEPVATVSPPVATPPAQVATPPVPAEPPAPPPTIVPPAAPAAWPKAVLAWSKASLTRIDKIEDPKKKTAALKDWASKLMKERLNIESSAVRQQVYIRLAVDGMAYARRLVDSAAARAGGVVEDAAEVEEIPVEAPVAPEAVVPTPAEPPPAVEPAAPATGAVVAETESTAVPAPDLEAKRKAVRTAADALLEAAARPKYDVRPVTRTLVALVKAVNESAAVFTPGMQAPAAMVEGLRTAVKNVDREAVGADRVKAVRQRIEDLVDAVTRERVPVQPRLASPADDAIRALTEGDPTPPIERPVPAPMPEGVPAEAVSTVPLGPLGDAYVNATGEVHRLRDSLRNLYTMHYEFVPVEQLLTSHTDAFQETPGYDQAYQNRKNAHERRKFVEAAVQAFDTNDFGPGGVSQSATDGAPTVFRDTEGRLVVLVGNGRTITIRQALTRYPELGASYRMRARQWARAMNMPMPPGDGVLVRVVHIAPDDRVTALRFAENNQESTSVKRAAAETVAGQAIARRVMLGRSLAVDFPDVPVEIDFDVARELVDQSAGLRAAVESLIDRGSDGYDAKIAELYNPGNPELLVNAVKSSLLVALPERALHAVAGAATQVQSQVLNAGAALIKLAGLASAKASNRAADLGPVLADAIALAADCQGRGATTPRAVIGRAAELATQIPYTATHTVIPVSRRSVALAVQLMEAYHEGVDSHRLNRMLRRLIHDVENQAQVTIFGPQRTDVEATVLGQFLGRDVALLDRVTEIVSDHDQALDRAAELRVMGGHRMEARAAEAPAAREPEAGATPDGEEVRPEGPPNERLFQTRSLREGKETLKRYGLAPGKRYTTREVAAALEARQRAKFGTIAPDDYTAEARVKIAKWMVEEILFEAQLPGRSGAGWYSEKYENAIDILGEAFPELKSDPGARVLFTAFVAVTSDGMAAAPNLAMAVDIYEGFRRDGTFSSTRGHNRNASIEANLQRIKDLYDSGGADAFRDMLVEITVGEYNKAERALAKAEGRDPEPITDYSPATRIPRSALVFGPKLGAFFANLMGSHGYLTMDRWWSRTFNRYRGSILNSATQSGIKTVREKLAAAYPDQGWATASDEAVLQWTAQSEREIKAKNKEVVKAYRAAGGKGNPAGSWDFKTDLQTSAHTVYVNAFEQLLDAPRGPSERTFMIDVAKEAQRMLRRRGTTMSIADIQAILWYYEKRLYGELGARQTADIAFDEAARRLVDARRAGSDGPVLGKGGGDGDADGVEGLGGLREEDPGDDVFDEGAGEVGDGGRFYQRRQTETPEFRAWFGDSKVVDESGAPLVVYHGTEYTGRNGRGITEFKAKKGAHGGYHFGSKDAANQKLRDDTTNWSDRGRKEPNYLVSQKDRDAVRMRLAPERRALEAEAQRIRSAVGERTPGVDLEEMERVYTSGDEGAIRAFLDARRAAEASPTPAEAARLAEIDARLVAMDGEVRDVFAYSREGENVLPVYLSIQNAVRMNDTNWGDAGRIKADNPRLRLEGSTPAEILRHLADKGYDGVVYVNDVEAPGAESYIAFRPEQIKSAIGNTGAFDPANPSILFQHRRYARALDAGVGAAAGGAQQGDAARTVQRDAQMRDEGAKGYAANPGEFEPAAPYGFEARAVRARPGPGLDREALNVALGYRPDERVYDAVDLQARIHSYIVAKNIRDRSWRPYAKAGNRTMVPAYRVKALQARVRGLLGDLPEQVAKQRAEYGQVAPGSQGPALSRTEADPIRLTREQAVRIRTLIDFLIGVGWARDVRAPVRAMGVDALMDHFTTEDFNNLQGGLVDAHSGAMSYEARLEQYNTAAYFLWWLGHRRGGPLTPKLPEPGQAPGDVPFNTTRAQVNDALGNVGFHVLPYQERNPHMPWHVVEKLQALRRKVMATRAAVVDQIETIVDTDRRLGGVGRAMGAIAGLAGRAGLPIVDIRDLPALRALLYSAETPPSPSVPGQAPPVVRKDLPRVTPVTVDEIIAHRAVIYRTLLRDGTRRLDALTVEVLGRLMADPPTITRTDAGYLFQVLNAQMNAAKARGVTILQAAAGASGGKDRIPTLIAGGQYSGIELDAYEAWHKGSAGHIDWWNDVKQDGSIANLVIVRLKGEPVAPYKWALEVVVRERVQQHLDAFIAELLDHDYLVNIRQVWDEARPGDPPPSVDDLAQFSNDLHAAIRQQMEGKDVMLIGSFSKATDVDIAAGRAQVHPQTGALVVWHAGMTNPTHIDPTVRWAARNMITRWGLVPDLNIERAGIHDGHGVALDRPFFASAAVQTPTGQRVSLAQVLDDPASVHKTEGLAFSGQGYEFLFPSELGAELDGLLNRNAEVGLHFASNLIDGREDAPLHARTYNEALRLIKTHLISGGPTLIPSLVMAGPALWITGSLPVTAMVVGGLWAMTTLPPVMRYGANFMGAHFMMLLGTGITDTLRTLANPEVVRLSAQMMRHSVRLGAAQKIMEVAGTIADRALGGRNNDMDAQAFVTRDGRIFTVGDVVRLGRRMGLDGTQANYETTGSAIDRVKALIDAEPDGSWNKRAMALFRKAYGDNDITQVYRAFYNSIDTYFRYAVVVRSLMDGMDPQTALNRSLLVNFDYTASSPFDKAVNKAVMFWMYQRRSIDLATWALVHHPGRVLGLLRFLRSQDVASGYGDEDIETVNSMAAGRPALTYLPVANSGDTAALKLMFPEPPVSTAVHALLDVMGLDAGAIASRLNPIMQTGLNLAMNLDDEDYYSFYRRQDAGDPRYFEVPPGFVAMDYSMFGGTFSSVFGFYPVDKPSDPTSSVQPGITRHWYPANFKLWDAFRNLLPGVSTGLTMVDRLDRANATVGPDLVVDAAKALDAEYGLGLSGEGTVVDPGVSPSTADPRLAVGAFYEVLALLGFGTSPIATKTSAYWEGERAYQKKLEGAVRRAPDLNPDVKPSPPPGGTTGIRSQPAGIQPKRTGITQED